MASDPHAKHIVRHFHDAIAIIDSTEPMIRHLIESELMDVAGINRTRISDAKTAATELTKKIVAIRTKAIKQAFRHLRDNLPSDV